MSYASKRSLKKFSAMASPSGLLQRTTQRWANETPNTSPPKTASDSSKEAAYLELFRAVSQSNVVESVKTAGIGAIFKHPAVAYGLGAAALGTSIPVAYGLGKQKAITDAQRIYGISPPAQIDPSALYADQIQGLGFAPDDGYDYYSDPYDYGLDSLYDDGYYY